jgi:hypothetical protein
MKKKENKGILTFKMPTDRVQEQEALLKAFRTRAVATEDGWTYFSRQVKAPNLTNAFAGTALSIRMMIDGSVYFSGKDERGRSYYKSSQYDEKTLARILAGDSTTPVTIQITL